MAYPVTQPQAGTSPRVTAVLALAALISGPALAHDHPRLASWLGIWGFVALSLSTWLQLGDLISLERLDPLRGALAALGWMFFAFGWGSLRTRGRVPEDDPHVIDAEPLEARKRPSRLTLLVLVVGVVGAMACLIVAWTVPRPVHSLLGHAAAVACAVWLVSTAGTLSTELGAGPRYLPLEAHRLASASVPLWALAVLVAAGVAWAVFR